MFSTIALVSSVLLASYVAAESHSITFTNNCQGGTPQWLYAGSDVISGDKSIPGAISGGIAWLGNYGNPACQSSGVNCGAVEWTLANTGTDQADITLEVGANGEWGNHQFQYPLAFEFTGSCSGGQSCGDANCPSASRQPDDIGQHLTNCANNDAGLHITFC